MKWHLPSGNRIALRQTTRYPWEGTVAITVDPAAAEEFTVFARIPGWSKENSVKVNGKEMQGATPGQYFAIRRRWSSGDKLQLTFDMRPQVVHANPAVADDRGRIALQRGPVVYCMEQLDQNQASKDSSVFPRYTAHLTESTTEHYDGSLLDGVVVLQHPGSLLPAASPALYQAALPSAAAGEDTKLKMIPYYAWSNRELSAMQVWIPFQQV